MINEEEKMIKNIIESNYNYDVNMEKINKLKSIFPECFDKNVN